MKALRKLILLILYGLLFLVTNSCKEDVPSIDCGSIFERYQDELDIAARSGNQLAVSAVRDRYFSRYPDCFIP